MSKICYNEARSSRSFYVQCNALHVCGQQPLRAPARQPLRVHVFQSFPSPFFYRILFLVCLLILTCCVLLVPAKSAVAAPRYSVDELSTNVKVNPDASVDVVSRQIIVFDEENEGLVWYLGAPSSGESYKITRVQAVPVDDGGAFLDGWTRLTMFDVHANEQGVNPGDSAIPELRAEGQQSWFSYSISDGMMRCWFPAESGRYMLEVQYTVYNAVNVYRDVAELSWRYAHDSYPVDMNDVTLQIDLPKPANEAVTPNDTVMAWGHGPDAGWFSVEQDGSVIYYIDSLQTGRHADAHVIFPASWMNNMYKNSPCLYTETQKAEILQDESLWVDIYSRQQIWDYKVRILFLGVAAVLLLVGVIGVVRFGQTYRSRRLLTRLAVVLLCIGLAVSLFFWESVSEWILIGIAAVVAIASLFFPKQEDETDVLPDPVTCSQTDVLPDPVTCSQTDTSSQSASFPEDKESDE